MKNSLIERDYKTLMSKRTFEERYLYLRLKGSVGMHTFSDDRILNQRFYQSRIWKDVRSEVLVRDQGFDLGCLDYPIFGIIIVHHMNPVNIEDLLDFNPKILDPSFLISTSVDTHNAIHFGKNKVPKLLSVNRASGDTILW